ncbi:hypothetical protein T4B_6321 [Trichinella pseudospiralis]|uniref:Uncharacterized protein n=1 Tax=Trichinella pseudospiralis TaxID=6337 RepID=A0A0V1JX65_TRIPS|nr:hypothetical protein T4B_6321 [Trichinella pseudospiralis]KRZ39603.1 hypothetical protein T4C_6270 [Trichinella pseudospiralis]
MIIWLGDSVRATLYTAGTQITGFFAEFHEPSYCRPVTTDSRKVMQVGRKTGIFEDHPLAWLSDGLLAGGSAHLSMRLRIGKSEVAEADCENTAFFQISGVLPVQDHAVRATFQRLMETALRGLTRTA